MGRISSLLITAGGVPLEAELGLVTAGGSVAVDERTKSHWTALLLFLLKQMKAPSGSVEGGELA